MIRIENLCKKLDTFELKDVNFTLDKGYIMGLIGPNGAGKTTIIKILMGLINQDSGIVKIFDREYCNNEEFIKNNIGFVYDELSFYHHLKVKDFERINSSFYKNYDKNKFEAYLKRFNISKKSNISNLSKGEGMRLMLASALSHDAKLLILDEPTAGLDPIVRKEILNLLQEAIEDGERSVIFSTHITSDLDSIADYITFIDSGKLVFSEDMESIKGKYKIFKGTKEEIKNREIDFIGTKEGPYYTEGLFISQNCRENYYTASLEEIMYYYVKGDKND